MRTNHRILSAIISAFLIFGLLSFFSACGGGGGSADDTNTTKDGDGNGGGGKSGGGDDGGGDDLDDIDNDTDGYTENEGDCDDTDLNINPGETEVCDDGIDQDCSDADLACDGGSGSSNWGELIWDLDNWN